MSNIVDQNLSTMEAPPRVNEFVRFCRTFFGRPVVAIGTIIIITFIIAAIFAPWIAPYDPDKTNLRGALLQPSSEHLLGTDSVGRDELSRLIFGSRAAILVGVVATTIAAVLGMTLGMIAGYYGGIVHAIIMRLIDALMVFPMILLAMILSALLGGGIKNIMVAIGISLLPGYARVMCGQTLSVKQNTYIMAEQAIGANNFRIMIRHVFPNAFPVMIVLMTMQLGICILAEAGLSYLGIGIRPPTPAWGGMVSDGYTYLLNSPMLSFAPGLAIMMVVFAFNMVGDGLRDVLDPRLRGAL